MKSRRVIKVLLLSCIVSCTPYVATKSTTSENKPQSQAQTPPSAPASSKNVQKTFLDTLNNGREVGLSQSNSSINGATTKNEAVAQTSTGTHYCIQLAASSQVETLRVMKRDIEKSVGMQLVIVFETPYYKLLAGDFTQRTDAETNVAKLKKMGYNDAWIVIAKPNALN